MALERVGVCILVVAALGVMACAGSGSEGEAGTGDSNPGGNFGAGGIDGRGGSGAEGPGPGGSTGGAGGGPGGAGGTASRHVSLPFANCKPVDDVVAIHPDLTPDRDPYCDDWVDMPPLVADEFGEVRIGDQNAYRGFAVSGCFVVYGNNVNEAYLYDLATNRQRRVAGQIGTVDSVDLRGNLLVFDSLDCSSGACERSLQINDLSTCQAGRYGVRRRDEGGSEYRLANISGSKVVWYETRANGCVALGALDVATGKADLLTPDRVDECNSGAQISGDWLTWSRTELDGTIVMLRNLSTGEERRVTPDGESNFYPSTDGTFVLWSRTFGATEDIHGYRIDAEEYFPVVTAPAMQTSGRVRDGIASWVDLRDSVSGAYSYTSALYEKELPDGEEHLVRPARTPVISWRRVGDGVIWLDARTRLPGLWARPER